MKNLYFTDKLASNTIILDLKIFDTLTFILRLRVVCFKGE